MRAARPKSKAAVPWIAGLIGVALFAMAVVTWSPLAGRAQTPGEDPAAVWRNFDAAINRGDAAGATSLFARDAVIEWAGTDCSMPCLGQEAIRQQLQQVVEHMPRSTILPGEQTVDAMVNGRWRLATSANTEVVPFTIATFNNQIAALRVDPAVSVSAGMPRVTGMVAAGSGGLLGRSARSNRLPIALATAAAACFALALLLGGLQLRGHHR